jgi:hypothetical protein
LWNIADSYDRYGDRERARLYAEKLPNLYKTRDSALIRLSDDTAEQKQIAAEAMDRMLYLLSLFLHNIYDGHADGKMQKIRQILNEETE